MKNFIFCLLLLTGVFSPLIGQPFDYLIDGGQPRSMPANTSPDVLNGKKTALPVDFKGNLGPCDVFTTLTCGQTLANQTGSGFKTYKITITDDGPVKFILNMQSGTDLDLRLYNSSCTFINLLSLEYNITTGVYREVLDARLTPGDYYLIVNADNGVLGNFSIGMDCTCTYVEPYSLVPFGKPFFCDAIENYLLNTSLDYQSTRWDGWEFSNGTEGYGGIASELPAGNKVAHFEKTANTEPNAIYYLDKKGSGRWRLSWRMYTEASKKAYYRVLHRTAENENVPTSFTYFNWAYEVYMNGNNSGYLRIAVTNDTINFIYPESTWFDVVNIVDMDNDVAELWIDGRFVTSWPFSLGRSAGPSGFFNQNRDTLAAVNFWAQTDHQFYVDDICFWEEDGTTVFCSPTGDKICIENGKEYVNDCFARLDLYTADEHGDCYSVCDLGGTFIYRGDTYNGTIDFSEIAPDSIRLAPCVQSAYNGNVPNPLYTDVFAFYNYDGQDVQLIFNAIDPLVKAFVFSCSYDDFILTGSDPKPSAPLGCLNRQTCLTDNGNTFVPTPCNDIYYVVITGPAGSTYSFNIIPSGDCASDPDTIGCGQTISGTLPAGTGDAYFSNTGDAYDACYNGQKSLNGAEQVYKFVLDKPSQVKITATSGGALATFLYAFVCGNSCIQYAENSAVDSSAVILTSLSAGTYYLILDRQSSAFSQNYALSLECISTIGTTKLTSTNIFLTTFIADGANCPSDTTVRHQIRINPAAYPFKNSDQLVFFGDDFESISADLQELWGAPSGQKLVVISQDDQVNDSLKCAFAIGDTIYMRIDPTEPGALNVLETRVFFDTVPGTNAGPVFKTAGISYIDSIVILDRVLFSTDKQVIDVSPDVATENFLVQSNRDWTITENPSVSWLAITPTQGTGSEVIELDFTPQAANGYAPRSTVLSIESGDYQTFVWVRQKGNCPPTTNVSITASQNTICQGDQVTLTATPNPVIADVYRYKWNTGDTSATIVKAPNASTPYSVSVTNTNCGIDATQTRTITVNPKPLPPTSLGDKTVCAEMPIPVLQVSVSQPNVNVEWFTDSVGGVKVGNGLTYQPLSPVSGTYYAQATFTTTLCTNPQRTPVTLTVNPLPFINTGAKDCAPNLKTWSVEVLTDGVLTTNKGIVTGNNGVYVVSGIQKGEDVLLTSTFTQTGCMRQQIVAGLPCACPVIDPPDSGGNVGVCEGTPLPGPVLTVDILPGQQAEWYNVAGDSLSSGKQYQPATPGTYYARARDLINQCLSDVTPVTLTLNPNPTMVVGTPFCSVDLTTYSVQVTTQPAQAILFASRGNISGQNGSFIVSDVAENTPVILTVEDTTSGCLFSQAVNGINCPCPVLLPPVSNGDQSICAGDTYPELSVSVNTGETVDWYDLNDQPLVGGQGTSRYTPLSPGTFYAARRNLTNGCTSIEKTAVTLTENPLPLFFSVRDTCNANLQSYRIIIASDGDTLITNPAFPVTFDGAAYTVSPIPIGTTVVIQSKDLSTGCVATQTVVRNDCDCVIGPATVNGPSLVSICEGDSLPGLSVSVNFPQFETADWFDVPAGGSPLPGGESTLTFVPAQTGVYYVQTKKTDAPSCVSGTRVAITVVSNPAVQVNAGPDQNTCAGAPVLLNGGILGAASGQWEASVVGGVFDPEPGVVNGVFYTPPQGAGSVTLTLISSDPPGPCPAKSDQMTINVLPSPSLNIDSIYCSANFQTYSVIVQASPANTILDNISGIRVNLGGGKYRIDNVAKNENLQLTGVVPGSGCVSTLVVPHPENCNCTVFPDKPVSKGDRSACSKDVIFPLLEVESVPGDVAVDWYDASIGGNLLKEDALTYQPMAADIYYAETRNKITGCVSPSRTAIGLQVFQSPTADAGPDVKTCPEGTVVLTAAGTNYAYAWSNGETTKSVSVPAVTATYVVTVTSNGCTDEDTVMVTAWDAPTATIARTNGIKCFGDSTGTLQVSATGGAIPYTVKWINGPTSPTNTNLPAGSYAAVVTDKNTCKDTAQYLLDQPTPLVIENVTVDSTSVTVFDGSITVNIMGGTPPYSFELLQGGFSVDTLFDTNVFNNLGAGIFMVIARDSNGCVLVIDEISTVVSAKNPALLGYAVICYPNPTNEVLHVRFDLPKQTDVRLTMTDLLGRTVLQGKEQTIGDNTVIDLDTRSLPEGAFMLRILMDDRYELVHKININR